jgi:hypothetical protein
MFTLQANRNVQIKRVQHVYDPQWTIKHLNVGLKRSMRRNFYEHNV